jgi:uncharacterized delta-60 repeat protein
VKKFLLFFFPIVLALFVHISFQSASAMIVQPGGVKDTSFLSGDGVNGLATYNPSIVVPQGGRYIVAGNFSDYNGYPVNNIVRVNTDGTVDFTFKIGTGANSWVSSVIVTSSDKILVVGDFSQFNGVTKHGIVMLNSDGSIDSSFNPATYSTVYSAAIQTDGKILISVNYNDSGSWVNRLLRLNANGTLDNTFQIGNVNNGVKIALQPDGKIIAYASYLYTYNGVNVNTIVRVNADGTLDNTFITTGFVTNAGNPSFWAPVITQQDGKIIVAGSFETYNGDTVNNLVRINPDGSRDSTFDVGTGFNNRVYGVALDSDKYIVVGWFSTYKGNPVNRIIRLNQDGTVDGTYNVSANSYDVVGISKISSSDFLIYGGFTQINGQNINYVAKIDNIGTLDTSFNQSEVGFNGRVDDIVPLADGKFIVSGFFTKYFGNTVNRIARINADGTYDPTYNVGAGFNNVNSLSLNLQADGKLIARGDFTSFDGTQIYGLARLNTDGSLDGTYNIGLGLNNGINPQYAFLSSSGKLITAPNATLFNGETVSSRLLIKINQDGSRDSSFECIRVAGDDSNISSIVEQPDGKLIIGGFFTKFLGLSRNSLIRINADCSLDTSFNASNGFATYTAVSSVALQPDGKIIVGGSFTNFAGSSRNKIVRLNSDGSLDTSFDVGTGFSGGYTIGEIVIQPDGKVLVGSEFDMYNGNSVSNIVRLNSDGTIDLTLSAATANARVRDIELLPDGDFIAAGDFTSFGGYGANSLAKVNATSSTLYQISGIANNSDAISSFGSVKVGSQNGSLSNALPVTLLHNGFPVVGVTVDLSTGGDRNWNQVSFATDVSTGKSYVFNLNPVDAPGASSTHTLYMPKMQGQDRVYICPNATSIDEVYIGCSGGYFLFEGASNLSVFQFNGVDYWKIDGLTGTGALGLSQTGTVLTLVPNTVAVSTAQEVHMTYTSSFSFASGDKVQFHFEPTAGFILSDTCGTPTTDANGDTFVDGSAVIVGSDIYEYTFSGSVLAGTISFCANVTSPTTAGSYSVRITDDNGTFDSAMYYVGGDNEVFVIANVAPSLSFNIRTLADDADTNICSFGTVSPSMDIPNADEFIDGPQECGYSLAVGTNAANGFQVQIQADSQLNNPTTSIADVVDYAGFAPGTEAYGLNYLQGAQSGRNLVNGIYDNPVFMDGKFADLDWANSTDSLNIPLSLTNFMSFNSGIQYVAGVDDLDVTKVVHGLVIGSGTPAGYYDQVVTYTTTANF